MMHQRVGCLLLKHVYGFLEFQIREKFNKKNKKCDDELLSVMFLPNCFGPFALGLVALMHSRFSGSTNHVFDKPICWILPTNLKIMFS